MEDFDETRLGSAVQVADQGIAILMPSDEATGPRIAYVNDGFCNLYGVTREEIVGNTVVSFAIVERHHAILTDMMQHFYENEPFDAEATAQRKDAPDFDLHLPLLPSGPFPHPTHLVPFPP